MNVEIEGFICFGHFEHEAKYGTKPYYCFKDYEPSEGFVVVQPHNITVDVPDNFDPRPQMVEKLEADKKKAAAEYQKRLTEIDAQIQSLLAIEA